MQSLDGVSTGCYCVETVSGTVYEVDLDNHTLARRPLPDSAGSGTLRRDRDRVILLAFHTCRIGESAVFLIDLRLQNVEFTARRSTVVRRIDPLGAGLDDAVLNADFEQLVTDWDGVAPGADD